MVKQDCYTQDVGRRGEEKASSFFVDKGFIILKKNYRYKRLGEIDLIVQKKDLIVFVEVKSRNTDQYGGAIYSINNRKKSTIRRIAEQFLFEYPEFYTKEYMYRFDLIAIDDGDIEWVEDIIR